MFDWLWRWLGLHTHTWSKWQVRCRVKTRAAKGDEMWSGIKKVQFTEAWQERLCDVCGKIQQKRLRYGAVSKNLTENNS